MWMSDSNNLRQHFRQNVVQINNKGRDQKSSTQIQPQQIPSLPHAHDRTAAPQEKVHAAKLQLLPTTHQELQSRRLPRPQLLQHPGHQRDGHPQPRPRRVLREVALLLQEHEAHRGHRPLLRRLPRGQPLPRLPSRRLHRPLQTRPRPPLPPHGRTPRGHRATAGDAAPSLRVEVHSGARVRGGAGRAGQFCLHLQDRVGPTGDLQGHDGAVRLRHGIVHNRMHEIPRAPVRGLRLRVLLRNRHEKPRERAAADGPAGRTHPAGDLSRTGFFLVYRTRVLETQPGVSVQDEPGDAGAADRSDQGGGGAGVARAAGVRGGDGRVQGLQGLREGGAGTRVRHAAAPDPAAHQLPPAQQAQSGQLPAALRGRAQVQRHCLSLPVQSP